MNPTLTEQDFLSAAAELGVPVAAIKAVCEVEAPQSGFDATGQPRILFEAHKFHALTGGRYTASHPSISSRTWNQALYAKGPTPDARNAAEHRRLQAAVELSRSAALMSASWGQFQILGENYLAAGHDSLQSFINAMYAGAPAQLRAFVEFVKNDRGGKLHQALKALDWEAFARLYNGPLEAKNRYAIRLAAAYRTASA